MGAHTEQSTLAACIATIAGVAPGEVPLAEDDRRAWLGERSMGLVPVQDAEGFAWAGPWIAWRPARDGSGPRAVVMFGVPSGSIWDPAGTCDEVLGGMVLAPLDIAVWESPAARAPGIGVVEAIVLGASASAPLTYAPEAVAIPGRGLEGDRYAAGAGTFASGRPGSALTLVDAAVLEDLAQAHGGPIDHRRNLVVRGADLNALVGRRFSVGEALCEGRRMCEPCAHLERLNGGGVLRPLVHRGGLRADIVEGGPVRVGDEVVAV
jgi:hypothetical protein